MVLTSLVVATVLRIWQPDPVPIVAHAGMMTRGTEEVVVAETVFLEEHQLADVSAGCQFVNQMRKTTVGIGYYLQVLDDQLEPTILAHPRVQNLMGLEQHYVVAQMAGHFVAPRPGHYRFEVRAYCGTQNLKYDGEITSVYNEMSIALH